MNILLSIDQTNVPDQDIVEDRCLFAKVVGAEIASLADDGFDGLEEGLFICAVRKDGQTP